jgi:hypothetical protein
LELPQLAGLEAIFASVLELWQAAIDVVAALFYVHIYFLCVEI